MNWSTGWISLGKTSRQSVPLFPPVSNLTLRSLPMTSGLFNTGVTGDSAEITSHPWTVQSDPSVKLMEQEFSADNFDHDFDMNMFGDLDADLDPLGDASLDSFTDLSALLTDTSFLDQIVDEDKITASPLPFLDSDGEVKPDKKTSKRSFQEMELEDSASDLGKLSASVGLTTASTHDHDYSTKRPRMSTLSEETSVENVEEEEEFCFPTPLSPAPSTSYAAVQDKSRNRREKNNIASKRSREIRKQKFAGMEVEADRLIADNAWLEQRVVQLERLAKQMKEMLVAKMAGK